eukprot:TRINITY_DN3115_c0_g1_i1.p1 TRINITY_DN3115_c0_g1~~TRINITY_DN3115_c0_g1_i1.p1  ORF type:complete len:297 (-),score=72.75 TRINITY_DN3115_c0_g1_i1:6-896(-)
MVLFLFFENDATINSLYIYGDGHHILSGDSKGYLKVWDTRAGIVSVPPSFSTLSSTSTSTPVSTSTSAANSLASSSAGLRTTDKHNDSDSEEEEEILSMDAVDGPKLKSNVRNVTTYVDSLVNEESNKPISDLHICRGPEDEGRYLAVNSYDNIIRVYDRGTVETGALKTMTLMANLSGHKNQTYPIKNSFFVGKNYQSEPQKSKKKEEIENKEEEAAVSFDVQDSLLLATGSADNNAYIFNLGSSQGGAKLLQKLERHTDRVYAVNFHPTEPILATCSSDFTVRLWSPKKKIYSQ